MGTTKTKKKASRKTVKVTLSEQQAFYIEQALKGAIHDAMSLKGHHELGEFYDAGRVKFLKKIFSVFNKAIKS